MKMSPLVFAGIISTLALPGLARAEVSIEKTIAACSAAGVKPAGTPVRSALRTETSLIGMAYLNYIYQNDLTNAHFREAMMLMNSQVPNGTPNPYVRLFAKGMGEKTLAVLQDVQLAFDYSIGRSKPSENKIRASIGKIQAALKK